MQLLLEDVNRLPSATRLLLRMRAGDEVARGQLWEVLYSELHARAVRAMRDQRPGITLQPTALMNEVWIKMFAGGTPTWECRRHFLSCAARAMRQALVDAARTRDAAKRGGGAQRQPLEALVTCYENGAHDLVALDEALSALERMDPEMARVVEMRFFCGAEMEEIAATIGTSKRTLERRWRATRAWLAVRLQ